MSPIPFIDLAAQRRRLGDRIERAIGRVLDHGAFIMGPEVATLERQLAEYCGARHAITCANGTDALALVMRARGIGPGDAVFIPAFTFVATAEVVPPTGATPYFVDVLPDTFNIDPRSLERGIADARRQGLRPRMVIPVDLFGQTADYAHIGDVASRHGLFVLADAAQSFGASLNNRRAGHLGDCTTTSFFPAKPLGCYGDGGAIFTDEDALADLLRSLRFHGKGDNKYDNVRVGFNSRLDTIQAAILIEKLAILDEEVATRNLVAERYNAGLANCVQVPAVLPGGTSAWAQYTIVVADRERVVAACKEAEIPTAVYYPIPLNRQTGYTHFPVVPGGVPVAEHHARHVISLPMHPYLDPATQDRIIAAVIAAAGQ